VDAFKRGGDKEVRRLLSLMETVTTTPDEELTSQQRKASLDIYRNANDAFRDLLKGKFGRLPLGWPADWVYKSAFGGEWRRAKASRSQESPLAKLKDLDFEAERNVLRQLLEREPSDEEFVLYLNHPADALKTFDQCKKYSNANNIPLDVWFEGAEKGVEIEFMDDYGKPHRFEIIDIPPPNENGISDVRYIYDSERLSHQVKLTEAKTRSRTSVMKADPNNPSQIAAPSTGQLWMTYVKVGDVVKKGEEIFNISVMKQENAVFSPADGMITRVLKSANFPQDKKMFPVVEGELIIEIGPIPTACEQCREPIILENSNFCPNCGAKR
jgi:pyruvate carboxylase